MRVFGSNDVAAYGDDNHSSWLELASMTLAQGPADGETVGYGEEFDLGTVSYRFVRFRIDNNYGSANSVGFAEIQYISTAVPEPGAGIVLGLVGLAGGLTRKGR